MLMRRFHRWFGFPLIVFLIAVTVTGIYLQAAEIIAADGSSDQPRLERSAPDDAAIQTDVAQALAIARQARPDFPVQKVEVSYRGDAREAVVSTNQRIGPTVTVDLVSGTASYVERPPRNLRTVFILLHSGKYFGMAGLVIIMLAGVVLLVLSFTGIWVYADMWNRRRKAGRTAWFWK
jgi:uncharacterized iron-regulated membrane protein